LVFMREILPGQIAGVRHLICTAAVALQTPSRPLYFALKDTLNRERRFPASLFFALRGAFRHRKLYLFRVNDPKGQDFVMLKAPTVLDPAHAVQALREVLTYVDEHPACTKAEMVTALAGGDEAKVKETLVQLAWLVEKGHVVEYYNDVLSSPLDYPVFRFLPGEKQAGRQQGGGRRQEEDTVSAPEAQPVEEPPVADEADVPSVPETPVPADESVEPVEKPSPTEEISSLKKEPPLSPA